MSITLQIIQTDIDCVYGSFLTYEVVVGGTTKYLQKYNNCILTICWGCVGPSSRKIIKFRKVISRDSGDMITQTALWVKIDPCGSSSVKSDSVSFIGCILRHILLPISQTLKKLYLEVSYAFKNSLITNTIVCIQKHHSLWNTNEPDAKSTLPVLLR